MTSAHAEESAERQVRSADLEVDLAALSDAGLVRTTNEDHFLVLRFGRQLEPIATNLPPGSLPDVLSEYGHALMVADGMGGHHGGAEASRRAITAVIEQVLAAPYWILRLDESSAEQVAQRSAERFRRASSALREEAALHSELAGMGTTLTVAVSFGLDLIVTHVGDSRVYLFSRGELLLLTRDQTMAQDFLDQGEAQVASRFRNVLIQPIGSRNPEPQSASWRLSDGDRVLLCSDGLTDMVDASVIAGVLREHPTSAAACQALVRRALAAGGRDNVTVAIAGYHVRRER